MADRDEPPATIRSFRLAFELERRIFTLDRWRLPLPYGVPVVGVAYAAAALAVVVLLARVPVVGALVALLPAPVRLLLVPVGTAYALMRLRVDGRTAHRFLVAWLRAAAGPRRVVAFRRADEATPVYLGDVELAADATVRSWPRAVVRGPARIVVRQPAVARRRGRALVLERRSPELLARPATLVLAAGEKALLR